MSKNLNAKVHRSLGLHNKSGAIPNYSGNAAVWGRLMTEYGIGVTPASYNPAGVVTSWSASDQYGGNEVYDDTPGRALCFCLMGCISTKET